MCWCAVRVWSGVAWHSRLRAAGCRWRCSATLKRAAPTWAMGQITDGLLQLFAHEQPLLRELRNRGLGLVNRLHPLKRWLTARALDS